MNVDDVVAARIAAARMRIEATKKRRLAQQAARAKGLAQRHAAKLRAQAARRPKPAGVPTPEPEETAMTDDWLPMIRSICTRLGIETPVVTDAFGRTDVLIDRPGMEKIRDTARATGFPELANGIDQMLAEGGRS